MTTEQKLRLAALGRLVDYAIKEAEDLKLPTLKALLNVALAIIAQTLG
jgi:hypothetical protein